MTRQYRIWFDANNGTMHQGYPLTLPGSHHDIQPIADKLKDGMRVVIYMGEELEMEAILEFDPSACCWVAHPVSGTLKYLDGSEPNSN